MTTKTQDLVKAIAWTVGAIIVIGAVDLYAQGEARTYDTIAQLTNRPPVTVGGKSTVIVRGTNELTGGVFYWDSTATNNVDLTNYFPALVSGRWVRASFWDLDTVDDTYTNFWSDLTNYLAAGTNVLLSVGTNKLLVNSTYTYTHPSSGVVAGSYTNPTITVDGNGHLTAATNGAATGLVTANGTTVVTNLYTVGYHDLNDAGGGNFNITHPDNSIATNKLQTLAAETLLGNNTGSTATPVAIPLGANLSFVGGALTASTGGTNAGTPVYVDSSGPFATLNLADGSKIVVTGSGTNATWSIVANSLETNDINSTFFNWINGKLTTPAGTNAQVLTHNGTTWVASNLVAGGSGGGAGTNIFVTGNLVSSANLTNTPGAAGQVIFDVSGSNIRAHATNLQTSLTFTNGVTNVSGVVHGNYLPGSNITMTTNAGAVTIAAVISTNSGTSVSVNGGSVLSTADFDTSAQIAIAESGGNITATIVDGSIGTNEVNTTFYTLLTTPDQIGSGTNLVLNGVLMQPAILTNNETAEAGRILWVTNASGHIRGYATNLPSSSGGGGTTFVSGTPVTNANFVSSANATVSVSTVTNVTYTFTGVGSATNGYLLKSTTIVTNTGGDGNVTHYTISIPGGTLSENGDELIFTYPGSYISYPSHVEEYFTWQFIYDGNPTTLFNHQATNSLPETSSTRGVLWEFRVKRLTTNTFMAWSKWDIGHGSGDDFTESQLDQLRVVSSVVTLTGDWDDAQDFSLSAQHDGTSGANEVLKTYGYTVLKPGSAGGGGSSSVSDTAYGAGWNGSTTTAPSQNAVYDEIELRATKASPSFTGTATNTGSFGAPVLYVGSTNVAVALANKQDLDADLTSLAGGTAMATLITNSASLGSPTIYLGSTNLAVELAAKAPTSSPTLTTPLLSDTILTNSIETPLSAATVSGTNVTVNLGAGRQYINMTTNYWLLNFTGNPPTNRTRRAELFLVNNSGSAWTLGIRAGGSGTNITRGGSFTTNAASIGNGVTAQLSILWDWITGVSTNIHVTGEIR